MSEIQKQKEAAIEEYEHNLINGTLAINNLEEWVAFKEIIGNLQNEYLESVKDESNLNAHQEGLKNFLELVISVIQHLDYNYKDRLDKMNFITISRQLQIMCTSNNYKTQKQELEEASKSEKNEPIKDFYNKEYFISEKYTQLFKEIKQKERKLYNEYFQVSMCLFGTKEQKLALIDRNGAYQKGVIAHKNVLLQNKLKKETKQDLENLKKDISSIYTNYQAIISNLEAVDNCKIKNITTIEEYCLFLLNCISKIEEKYNGDIPEEEVPHIINQIENIVKGREIEIRKKEIINKSNFYTENSDKEIHLISDYKGKNYGIIPEYIDEFNKLVIEEREFATIYAEAEEFIFGNAQEENRKL